MSNDPFSVQDMALEDTWPLIRDVFEKGGRFRLFPRGTSMLPLIRPGIDSVLLEHPHSYSRYDILLYRRQSGQFVLHRLMRLKKSGLVMCGDNQYVLEYGVPAEAVLARVTGIYFGEEYVPLGDPRLKRYAKRRAFSRPIRHLIAAMKRCLSRKQHIE